MDIILISDLHLASGYDRRTGTYHRNEDFFYDGALGRFIDWLLARAVSEQRRWRLVLLGDFLDFLQVHAGGGDEAALTSSSSAKAKLDVVAAGHVEAFAALGRFVAAGHTLDVVIGNHDIELIWPDVQARFRELVEQHAGGAGRAAIMFHPWILYIPGLLYAEHGQQYDSLNAFATLMRPLLPSDPGRIELPLGSFIVLYLFNHIERIDPFADNVRPMTRYLLWALRVHPVVALSTLGYHVRFFLRVLGKTSSLSVDEQKARREAYWRELMAPAAAQIGLPEDTLIQIDKLAAIPALSNRRRELQELLLRPLLPALPFVATGVAIWQAAKRLPGELRMLLTLAAGVGGLAWRERRLLRPATEPGNFLLHAARAIDKLLRRQGLGVPVYVFGHTHTAERWPLGRDDEAPAYLNAGTWTPVVPQAFDILGARERFSFVQITRNADGTPRVELMLWNDSAGRAEPMPLLMM